MELISVLGFVFLAVTVATFDLGDDDAYDPLWRRAPDLNTWSMEKQRYDGWYNNMAYPEWGSKESRLTRKAPPAYGDGVYTMAGGRRPNARKLSQTFMRGTNGLGSSKNRTALLAFFGQVVSAEILLASENGCPLEIHHIPIEKCDEMYDKECEGRKAMPFYRANYDHKTGQSPNMPREQLNRMTSWIDGSFIYSTQEVWVSTMRSFKGDGSLKWGSRWGMPPHNTDRVPLFNHQSPHFMRMTDLDKMFLLGDPRTNQNAAFLAIGILFYRWHNVLAARIKRRYPGWSDESVFQAARRWNIATLQNIIAYEYLPAFVGQEMPPYSGYKPEKHPGISHAFQSAGFRYGHTLIPPGIMRRDAKCNFRGNNNGKILRLCSTWWEAHQDSGETEHRHKVEEIFRGLSSQISEREDEVLCTDIREKLFGPVEFSRRDLATLNIMRGRDSGLPDYNTVRKSFGLAPVQSLEEINPRRFAANPELLRGLREMYGQDLSSIDLYVGGMLETGDDPGPLFTAIILEQFQRLRDSDRFWFENEGVFLPEEVEDIKKIRMWDIIVNATTIKPEEIQKDVFFWHRGDPCPQPKQLNASELMPCELPLERDSFQGSELPFTLAGLFVLLFPLLCAGGAYLAILVRRRHAVEAMRNSKETGCLDWFCPVDEFGRKLSASDCSSLTRLRAREWAGPSGHYRTVYLKLTIESAKLDTFNRRGDQLRSVSLGPGSLDVLASNDANPDKKVRPLLLIKLPETYDIVLEFENKAQTNQFVEGLKKVGVGVSVVETSSHDVFSRAETRETRQRKMEQFFKQAYSITFGGSGDSSFGDLEEKMSQVTQAMKTSLTRFEFAQALGMKQSDVFVEKMFRIIDKDGNGKISFQEFLDTVTRFSSTVPEQTNDDKLKIVFEMCDTNRDGRVDKGELQEMMASLISLAKTERVLPEEVTQVTESMFDEAGLSNKKWLNYDDFKAMMLLLNDGDFSTVGLDFKGAKLNFFDQSISYHNNMLEKFTVMPARETPDVWWADKVCRKWKALTTFLEGNRQHIFYLTLFYVTTAILFIDKFIKYAYLSEHTDMRNVMGMGIAITRGSASAMSFCYSLLILSMARNLLTRLKETFIYQYIPIDSYLQFHKICACTAAFFTVTHSVGHIFNFYHVVTQPVERLMCLMPELSFPPGTQDKPDMTFWLLGTVAGSTGLLLYAVSSVIYVFALPAVREKAFNCFWFTHQLYILLYGLSLMHGLQKLTSSPTFWMFFVGPAIIYTFDKFLSLRISYMELHVLETELLPSDVIKITFYRPPNFDFRSGQWVRVCCESMGQTEYHSLSITSAPHEKALTLHIKARGPWTWRLRHFFDPKCSTNAAAVAKKKVADSNNNNSQRSRGSSPAVSDSESNFGPNPPKIRLQGPFGGGNQDWYKFEVAVMIGAGIGVTPYSSILNDLVHGASTHKFSGVACKKVYFLWICPSHKSFEWFIDVLRDVEKKDVTNVLDIHIFITQFFHKYDLRTTMLYICENHFQRLSGKSLFTGLKASNHFGRPDLVAFLSMVQRKHNYISKVGVFSCGPRAVTRSSESACETVNQRRKPPHFTHHFEQYC